MPDWNGDGRVDREDDRVYDQVFDTKRPRKTPVFETGLITKILSAAIIYGVLLVLGAVVKGILSLFI